MESSVLNLLLIPWKTMISYCPDVAVCLLNFQIHKECPYLHMFLLGQNEISANTDFFNFSCLFLALI